MCEFNEKMEFEECIEDTLNTPEFFSKFEEDDREAENAMDKKVSQRKAYRSVARVRNHQFKRRQWRRFLSYYPALNTDAVSGLGCLNAIFVGGSYYDNEDETYYNRHLNYNLNFYNHLFISKRGDLRTLRGKIEVWRHDMAFVTGTSSVVKDMRKRTNRCVRHMRVSEDNCNNWNYYRRQHIESFE